MQKGLLNALVFYFILEARGRKKKLDPVDRCVGTDPGAIHAADMPLEPPEMGHGRHFPSFNVQVLR